MRRLVTGLIIIVLACCIGNEYSILSSQQPANNKSEKRSSSEITIICYAGKEPKRVYTPPPESFLKNHTELKGAKSTFKVTYDRVPADAMAAFQYAVDIWESLLSSSVPINVLVTWDQDMASGTLGATYLNPSDVVWGQAIDAYVPNAYYPYTIAEKILGQNVNDPDDYEIRMDLNGNQSWYTGTDGNTPVFQFDLVTVALHELGHGLGFNSTIGEYNDLGWWGYTSGLTLLFDHFVKNGAGQQLIDTSLFDNGSVELLAQITSDNLRFDSPIAKSVNSGIAPRLFAPAEYDEGSSVYHLNETTYSAGNINSLMTPFISPGEAIHTPGPITLAMFAEIGWIHTNIEHDSLKDAESLDAPFTVIATIASDTTLVLESTFVYYSTDGFITYDSVAFGKTANPDEYTADIPLTDTGVLVNYYLTAEDYFNRLYTKPAGAPERYYRFFVGQDTVPPEIDHTPIDFILEGNDTVEVFAYVTDNIGIDSVVVEYMVNGVPSVPLPFVYDTLDLYSGDMIFGVGVLEIGDSVQYRIVARDSSLSGNLGFHPDTGYHLFYVEEIMEAQDSYFNDFDTDSLLNDFLLSGFTIKTESGFNNGALHTDHNYIGPEENNKFYLYTAQLKIPIRLKDSNALITFDEIVLVEPGTNGTVFGDAEFWDYVMVQGSKNFGENWDTIADGWDSRYNTIWNATYNSSTDNDGNSTTVGTPNLFREHQIDLLAESGYSGGDEILIRFVLYSDAYAWGWGWAIDNLNIQGELPNAKPDLFDNENIRVFPNPTKGNLVVSGKMLYPAQQLDVIVADVLGREIYRKSVTPAGEQFRTDFDLSGYANGLYFVKIEYNRTASVFKVIKYE